MRILFASLLLTRFAAAVWYNPAHSLHQKKTRHEDAQACAEPAYVFTRYLASEWEKDWVRNADTYALDVCGTMISQAKNSQEWVHTAAKYRATSSKDHITFTPTVWSRFEYRRGCSHTHGDATTVVPIEPTVGHMRHPFAWGPCLPPGVAGVTEEGADRESVLVNPMPPRMFSALYPGRRYLLDLGTGPSYNSSLQWFVDEYARQNIHFDSIWTWEANTIDQTAFWKGVPPHMQTKLHLHNTPVTAQPGDGFNPVELIQRIYQPGDFVVLKLDLEGNVEVEGAIVNALLGDPEFRKMVGELMYELHWGAEIFGLPDISLDDALQSLQALREVGVRVHFWP